MKFGDVRFKGKRVLLLQGPVGPFFRNLAKDLEAVGAEVMKINFNAGDWLFYPRRASSFKGSLVDWLPELKRYLLENRIDAVLLFGDCRPVHEGVRQLGRKMGFAVGVFEEGYLRPDHVTFEPIGVNGHSQFHESLETWLEQQFNTDVDTEDDAEAAVSSSGRLLDPHQKVGRTYWHGAIFGMLYFFAAWLGQLS